MASTRSKKNSIDQASADTTAFRAPFSDSYDLPSHYGTTTLKLVARDPSWIYAYWEIAQSTIDEARARFGQDYDRAAHVLRMYDVTCIDFNGSNQNRSFDLDVGPHSMNWYVNLWSDCVSYCGERGIRLPNGEFFPFVRSNTVTTPRTNPSNRYEEIWIDGREKKGEPGAPFILPDAGEPKGISQDNDPRISKPVYQNEGYSPAEGQSLHKVEAPQSIENRKKRFYLTEADVRDYYIKLSPALWDLISMRLAKRMGKKYDTLHYLTSRKYLTLDEILSKGLSRGQFVRRLLGGASEELAEVAGGQELVSSGGASEKNFENIGTRKFFFELGTELIVYGRTEPDAAVYLGDTAVPLRSDGTFSMRFALPDGKIPLAFKAVSGDKIETRHIETAVERMKTEYRNIVSDK